MTSAGEATSKAFAASSNLVTLIGLVVAINASRLSEEFARPKVGVEVGSQGPVAERAAFAADIGGPPSADNVSEASLELRYGRLFVAPTVPLMVPFTKQILTKGAADGNEKVERPVLSP